MKSVSAELDQQLEELLAEGVEGARKREATTFDDLAGSQATELVLFGAGNLGRRALAGLRKAGMEPLCFVDSDKARWGEELDGLPVFSPDEGSRLYGSRAVFIVTIWRGEGAARMSSRVSQLRQLGCKSVVPFLPLFWKFSASLLPNYLHDLPHHIYLQSDRVRKAYQLMADDESRREYLAQLRYRLLGDFECLPDPVQGAMYFREELFSLWKNETLVDCGAFDGDTLSLFLAKTGNSFNGAIAFEPDPVNFEKLAERVNRMAPEVSQRITLHQTATGEINERVLMDVGSGVASQVGKGDQEVESVALDSLLQGVAVSFIKMDIEGSELATLAGAKRLIRQNSPILAISAYHRQDDLWNIPLFIRDLNPDYSIHLRPHMLEGWDLVCYAIPGSRRATKVSDAEI
jgi:FkbM family methyltransferase